jgi:hypothetical protein
MKGGHGFTRIEPTLESSNTGGTEVTGILFEIRENLCKSVAGQF